MGGTSSDGRGACIEPDIPRSRSRSRSPLLLAWVCVVCVCRVDVESGFTVVNRGCEMISGVLMVALSGSTVWLDPENKPRASHDAGAVADRLFSFFVFPLVPVPVAARLVLASSERPCGEGLVARLYELKGRLCDVVLRSAYLAVYRAGSGREGGNSNTGDVGVSFERAPTEDLCEPVRGIPKRLCSFRRLADGCFGAAAAERDVEVEAGCEEGGDDEEGMEDAVLVLGSGSGS